MFSGYSEFSEARYFADQAGVFEVRKSTVPQQGKVMMQVRARSCDTPLAFTRSQQYRVVLYR